MSLRTHAVVVQPERWSGSPAELARLLAPITGLDLAPLSEALARGPMTVEADLSAAEARALVDRLSSLGVPAEIHPPAPPTLKRPHGAGVPGAIEVDRARITDEVPRSRSSTMMGFKPMVTDEAEDTGWGAVFPDLAPKTAAPKPAPALNTAPPSLDDLEDAPPAQRPHRSKVPTAPLGQTATTPKVELTPPMHRETEPPVLPVTPPTPPVVPRPVVVEAPAQAQRAPAPPQTASRAPDRPAITPVGFDASKLAALLPEDDEEDRPPYKPSGYDPRPEHHPPFAAMFAVLAPGAGHIFNGDDDKAMSTAFRSWAIMPWIRSVKASRQDAEKIRTFWAPRPEEGSGLRAFKFVFAFWLCVGIVAAMLAWAIPTVTKIATRDTTPVGVTPQHVETAFGSAETGVLTARVKALDALEKASADLVPEAKYTMTETERAERLFAIGYFECKRKSFMMCEAMMKRVLELRTAYGPAIRLQAWASVSKGGSRDPFPDIGYVPTLSELELNKMREEMILEGEEVPPPPEPGTAFAPESAGTDAGSANADDVGLPAEPDSGGAP